MWKDRIEDAVLAVMFVAILFLFFGFDRLIHWLKNRVWKEGDEKNNRDPPDFTRMGDGTVNR